LTAFGLSGWDGRIGAADVRVEVYRVAITMANIDELRPTAIVGIKRFYISQKRKKSMIGGSDRVQMCCRERL